MPQHMVNITSGCIKNSQNEQIENWGGSELKGSGINIGCIYVKGAAVAP